MTSSDMAFDESKLSAELGCQPGRRSNGGRRATLTDTHHEYGGPDATHRRSDISSLDRQQRGSPDRGLVRGTVADVSGHTAVPASPAHRSEQLPSRQTRALSAWDIEEWIASQRPRQNAEPDDFGGDAA